MSVVGNCGVQSSCSKSFLCIWLRVILGPKSSDDFSPMGTTSPLWNLLLGIGEILPLGQAAFYGGSLGQPLDVLGDGTPLPVPRWSVVTPTAQAVLGDLQPHTSRRCC